MIADHNLQVVMADHNHLIATVDHPLQIVMTEHLMGDHQTKEVNLRMAIQTLDPVMTLKIKTKIHLTLIAI